MKTILLNKIKELKAIIDDPGTARKADYICEEIEHWENEIDQMFDDKENKMITAALCGASMLIGFILGVIIA